MCYSARQVKGHRLMRLTYFDDAGLFNAQQEPFIVIGGVIVHADAQLIPLEEHIDRLVHEHIPEGDRTGFVFHAMELWHGGRYFDRENWPLQKRLEILADLAAIPAKFDIPVSFGYQKREHAWRFIGPAKLNSREVELQLYSDTYARFCESIEMFMREAASDEITVLIGEDNDAIHAVAKMAHQHYRDPNWVKETAPLLTYFPFERIRESVHFAKKPESKALQIADMCTFIIKRRLMNDPRIGPLYEALEPMMVVLPKPELLTEQSC